MRDGGKWIRSEPRQTSFGVLAVVVIAIISSTAQAEVLRPQDPSPQERGIAVKADTATLCALIGKMQVLTLKYNYDPDAAEPRELEPYGVGYTRKGNVLLFGRQVKGYSKSAENGAGELPGWRNFRVDRIKMRVVNAMASTFDHIRPQPAARRTIAEFMCEVEVLR
jgi:hypothetical protein